MVVSTGVLNFKKNAAYRIIIHKLHISVPNNILVSAAETLMYQEGLSDIFYQATFHKNYAVNFQIYVCNDRASRHLGQDTLFFAQMLSGYVINQLKIQPP